MKKKLILYIIAFSLILTFVNALSSSDAYDFDVEIKVVKGTIFLDETAEYQITIYNNNDFSNRFRFDAFEFTKWSSSTKPNMLSGIEIAANSKKTVRLLLFPVHILPGIYSMRLTVRSDKTTTILKKPFQVNIKSEIVPRADYKADIKGTFVVGMGSEINPRYKTPITIKLKNKNLLYITDLNLKVESETGFFSFEKKGLNFIPLEQKDVIFQVELDPKTMPQEDKLIISWETNNITFGPYGYMYDIIGYELPFEITKEIKKKILRTDNVITITNLGTLEKEESVKVEIIKRSFTRPKPDANVFKEDSKEYFVFNIKLAPGETKEVKTITSYRLISFIILLILIGVILYYNYRSPIVIRKKESVVKMREGGISELKVLLYVKNRSKMPVENIEIKEIIPHIAEIDKEIQIGTIKPSSVTKHKAKGTIAKWEISTLDKFEERIITYNIKSKLSILGGLTLPATKAKFKAQGKERVTISNKLKLTCS